MTSNASVVVLGGGVIGLSVAWRCIERGLEVTVVDPHVVGAASPAAAGMLAPVTEAHFGESALLGLNLRAAQSYPTYVEALTEGTGTEVSYRRSGTVSIARDRDEHAELVRTFDFLVRNGLEATLLNPREARALEPQLAPSVQGGIHVADDHQVDNRALLEALRRVVARRATLVQQEAVGVRHENNRVLGVQTAGGDIAVETVVIAMGAWAARLNVDGVAIPVRPVKGQLLHLRSATSIPQLTRNIRGLEAYIVPRSDGRIVVGASVEEQGFDTRATAGATYALLRAAVEIVPGLTECELVEVATGLRPGTPDNAPLIGPTEIPGLFLATGHYRNGVLLAFETGEAIAHMIVTDTVPEVMAPFSPARFRTSEVSKA